MEKQVEHVSELDVKNLAILYRANLICVNNDEVYFNFEGFIIAVRKEKDNGMVCSAMIRTRYAEIPNEKTYSIFSIDKLNTWLCCIKKHSHMLYLVNSCKDVLKIPEALKQEFFYLVSKLNLVMECE